MQGTESGHRKEKKPGTWDTCTSDYCKRLMKKEYTATCSRSQDLWNIGMTAVFDKATSRHMLEGFFPSSFCCTACILYMYLYLGASRRISSASKDFLRMQVCFSLRYVFFHARLHCKNPPSGLPGPEYQVCWCSFHIISWTGKKTLV